MNSSEPPEAPGPGHQYTVGWIYLHPVELAVVQAGLEEIHARRIGEENYVLGRIGEHGVVVAGFSVSDDARWNAPSIAYRVLRDFPSIRFLILVDKAIARDQHKSPIRVGDVVVATSVNPIFGELSDQVLYPDLTLLRVARQIRFPRSSEAHESGIPSWATKLARANRASVTHYGSIAMVAQHPGSIEWGATRLGPTPALCYTLGNPDCLRHVPAILICGISEYLPSSVHQSSSEVAEGIFNLCLGIDGGSSRAAEAATAYVAKLLAAMSAEEVQDKPTLKLTAMNENDRESNENVLEMLIGGLDIQEKSGEGKDIEGSVTEGSEIEERPFRTMPEVGISVKENVPCDEQAKHRDHKVVMVPPLQSSSLPVQSGTKVL